VFAFRPKPQPVRPFANYRPPLYRPRPVLMGLGAIDSTDTILFKQLHQAAIAAYQAKVAGNKAAEEAARKQMVAFGKAYTQAGHSQDELDYIKAHPFATPNPLSWLQGVGVGGALVAGGLLLLLLKGKV